MKSYDLVVAGAGPAGLTLAWKAAEDGLGVLVFDKKRDAGDIAYTTSASFIDLKRWELPHDVAHPISKIHFSSTRTREYKTPTFNLGRMKISRRGGVTPPQQFIHPNLPLP